MSIAAVGSAAYYADLWGTVHRHDHTHIAERILARYDPETVLDIGAGCGWLVHTWRQAGVRAWGVEPSAHALGQRCSPYLIEGSFTKIPFGAGHFDVVFSFGVLQYVPVGELASALAEAQRVGTRQYHVVDFAKGYPEEKYAATNEPEEFWAAQFDHHGFVNDWMGT